MSSFVTGASGPVPRATMILPDVGVWLAALQGG